jgi:uncharacterized repeat protein (TIGR01451 family)
VSVEEEVLPRTGPLPAPSAGATGLAPPLRFGPASADDIAAGTGYCDVPAADLTITKTDSPDPICAGRQLTYTIKVTNNGDETAHGVQVTDDLPPGAQLVSASPSQGSCNGTTCNLGSIDPGDTVTVTIRVTPNQAGTNTNTASVSTASAESDDQNNSAQATTTVRQNLPDLTPVKITVETAPRRGRTTTLASNIKNPGCVDAVNVVVRFLDNGQQIGTDRTIPLIVAGRGKSATIRWRPQTAGAHTITAIADPDNLIQEIDDSNNSFSRTYQVRA